MSHKTYNELFKKTQDILNETLQLEPVQADRRDDRDLLANLYVRYIGICNRLSICVDQVVQPQKRMLLLKLLEAALGRILELKTDLVEADLNEFTHCGDTIENLRITPIDRELIVPECFTRERQEEIEYNKRVIDEVLSKLGYLDKTPKKTPMTEQQAILIIQKHERARQGRLRQQFMKEIRTMKEKSKPVQEDAEEEAKRGGISLTAAMKIQKIWRGYIARRATRRRKIQEMLLIGMIPPLKTKSVEIEKDLENKNYRRKLQVERRKEYEKSVKNIRESLEKNQRGAVLEQLSDQVRAWLQEYKATTGKIPEYTGEDRSASRNLLSRQGTDSELSKSTQISSKESKTKKDKGKTKESKADDVEEDQSTKALVSTFVPELNLRKEEYDEVWRNKDESGNFRQYHYRYIIEQEQMAEMENELRKVVDEMMRAELELLQEAFDKDRGHKGKKKSSKKARRGGKKSKKKKEKDLTPDRTTESLFEELVANGIIKKYPEVRITDFQGEISFYPPSKYNVGSDPPIALGDIRQLLLEYCVVPFLTPNLHQTTPHVKSLLLTGSKGSGKKMLLHAVCTETGSVLFDLTPSNIVGKYPGKSGLIMLIHLVLKVSRLLQPSIIYMDNAERPFVKKIPKTDKSDPKRLKKDLPKVIKNFSPEDRVMLIGTSNFPWECDQKMLQQVYQKFIMIPSPNYSSRYTAWSNLLGQYMPVNWQFDMGLMTRISDAYTIGSIISTINEVMTVKRMLQLRIHPLSPLELVNALCKRTPIYKEEEEAFEQWWSKVPTVRKRTRAVELLQEEQAELAAKQQANAKKKM
ncbi:dynein regulatory complex protein 11 [Diabrotica virgifera virgifera]|uniref:ATPase AAA-type core domain-containing protein n=2 Tax=Diabrotica TaxID=50385 RepID=A0ABM5KM61_DIAVI|nr:dynein regulatory complex protein 11 [Diabrotica virgifera virgifera]